MTPEPSPILGCDGCTACCKFMKVRELEKPANTWCVHCTIGTGCKIYDARPESCQVRVVAHAAPRQADCAPALRPDRSRVVIGTANQGEDVALYVAPDRGDAWKHPELLKLIGEFGAWGVKVLVNCNDEIREISP